MNNTNGHFEQGRWVEESIPPAACPETAMEERLSRATASVLASVEELAAITHDLMTTGEGKQYVEKTIQDTRLKARKTVDRMIRGARGEVQKTMNATL